MEDGEIDDVANGTFFHPRSHSLRSNLIFASSPLNIGRSLTTIPSVPFQQQTLVGIEALDGGRSNGGLFLKAGRTSPSNRMLNDGNANNGGINFGRRISRQDPQRPYLSSSWIERVFQRRECIKFIPADTHSDRCYCGRPSSLHSQLALSRFTSSVVIHGDLSSAGQISGQWTIGSCTSESPTDAYGTIEFQGGTHVHKARYVRLSFDSDPLDVITLMERVWGFERPRLVISVHGGTADFNVPEKLGRVFREGLLKAAETTGAWVFTSGLDSGVVKHVARALDEAGISARMRSRIVTVGIAPWGLLRHRQQLIGCDSRICYDRQGGSRGDECGNGLFLNDRHSYFLLVDNGTVDRYGAEIVLRRRLEEFLARKAGNGGAGGSRIPIICLALEGGLCTLNGIHHFLHGPLTIPVIICEGSGRVSDLLAMAERHLDSNGKLPANVRSVILKRINEQLIGNSAAFIGSLPPISTETILNRIVECAAQSNKMLTVYRLHRDHFHSNGSDMDRVILHTLLHSQNLTRVDQLLLTLAWGREDIARSEIFKGSGKGDEFPSDPDWLFQPMMEALLKGNVDFVRLILEQGLNGVNQFPFNHINTK